MFKCNICGKEFDSSTKLGGHKGSHNRKHKRKKIVYNCINCGKHVETYDDRVKRKYCCQKCHYAHQKKVKDDKIIYGVKNSEIESYRKKQLVCEICGNREVCKTNKNSKSINNLCIDHDHSTGKFRGFLCNSCNRKLAWYENEKENIERFLELNSDFNYVRKKIS